jgi:hypothetical protein
MIERRKTMSTNGLQKVTKSLGDVILKNSPTILTGLSVAGLISTAVMAVKATPKAIKMIEDEYKCGDENYSLDVALASLTKREIIRLTWRCYIPSLIMGGVTIACIIGANSINLRRNAALASAYSLTEAALKEYKAKVVETIGENKEKEITDDIAKDRVNKNPVSSNEVIVTGGGDTLCYDALSGRYFKSDMESIRTALNNVSRRLMNEMFIGLNEVYSALGLEGTKIGDLLGFHVDDGLIEHI